MAARIACLSLEQRQQLFTKILASPTIADQPTLCSRLDQLELRMHSYKGLWRGWWSALHCCSSSSCHWLAPLAPLQMSLLLLALLPPSGEQIFANSSQLHFAQLQTNKNSFAAHNFTTVQLSTLLPTKAFTTGRATMTQSLFCTMT